MVKIKKGDIFWNTEWQEYIKIIQATELYVKYEFVEGKIYKVTSLRELLEKVIIPAKAYNSPLWKVMNS
jgi:hypothetical protein